MPHPGVQAFTYLRTWLTRRSRVRVEEVRLEGPGDPLPATWFAPPPDAPPSPAWVVLHGLTRTGRSHPSLVRFARALASASGGVLIPEIPAWQALYLAPGGTLPTLHRGLDWLEGRPEHEGTARGLVGFSFGAPQAIAATGDPAVAARVDGVAGFGGYCDLERTIRYQLTGLHEWRGREHHHRPDPYGRWIVAGNYLPGVPGYEGSEATAEALLELARVAGDRNLPSWDASLDPAKEELRRPLDPAGRRLFDRLAAPDGSDLGPEEGAELARGLADTAATLDPLLEVRDRLGAAGGRVEVLHGRRDHLIPYTEALRLREALPDSVEPGLTVTEMFGHSAQDRLPLGRILPEGIRFARALARVMGMLSDRS